MRIGVKTLLALVISSPETTGMRVSVPGQDIFAILAFYFCRVRLKDL